MQDSSVPVNSYCSTDGLYYNRLPEATQVCYPASEVPQELYMNSHYNYTGLERTGVGAQQPLMNSSRAVKGAKAMTAKRLGRQLNPPAPKPKRKRIITTEQRKAANIRERRRMISMNDAFDLLRKVVPTFAYEKKLSRIETLRLAITYMNFLTSVLHGQHPSEVKLYSDSGYYGYYQ